jgi:hypothetical protein
MHGEKLVVVDPWKWKVLRSENRPDPPISFSGLVVVILRPMTRVDRKGALLIMLLAVVSIPGCSFTQPNCLAVADTEVVGKWIYAGPGRYAMRRRAVDLDRPDVVEFRQDGSFVARFSDQPSGDGAAKRGEVTGRWSAGRYCLESLFIPRTQISTTPSLPNTATISLIGNRLLIVGADSGVSDAEYQRSEVGAHNDRSARRRHPLTAYRAQTPSLKS